MKVTPLRTASLTLLISVLLAAGLQAQSLKVPYVSVSPNPAPLWIAEAGGLYKKHNLDVELIYIPGGTVIIQAMLSGEVKVANMAPPAAITAWAKGAEIVLVATGVNRLLETVITAPQIKRVEDLKGKKIGVSRYGSLTDVILREGLRHYKLNPDKEVTILQAGSEGARLAALKAGALDGAMLSGDQKLQAEKLGFRVVIDFSELPIDYPINGMVARRDFVRNNRDISKRFLKAWIEGIKIFKTDKDFTIKVLRKYLRVEDREILEQSYETYKPVFERIPYPERKGVSFAMKRLVESFPEAGKLKLDDFLDDSIISELVKEGFINDLYAEKATKQK